MDIKTYKKARSIIQKVGAIQKQRIDWLPGGLMGCDTSLSSALQQYSGGNGGSFLLKKNDLARIRKVVIGSYDRQLVELEMEFLSL